MKSTKQKQKQNNVHFVLKQPALTAASSIVVPGSNSNSVNVAPSKTDCKSNGSNFFKCSKLFSYKAAVTFSACCRPAAAKNNHANYFQAIFIYIFKRGLCNVITYVRVLI